MKKLLPIVLLIAIFGASVIIRLNNISNTIDNNNQCHAFLLTTNDIWSANKPSMYHYAPIQTYANEGDKFNNFYKRLEDKKGDNYYISYPPFTFIFVHYFFKITQIPSTQLPLQILNFLLHFVSAFIVYLICCKLLNKEAFSWSVGSLMGYTSYLFISSNLYLHTEVFFPEMLGQFFMLAGTYFYLRYIENSNNMRLATLLIIVFFGVYTEWLCLIWVSVILLINRFNNKKLTYSLFLISIVSLATTAIQYSSINGFNSFARSMLVRYYERSGFLSANDSFVDLFFGFIQNLNHTLFPFGYVAVLIYLITKQKTPNQILKLTLYPVIIYIVLFFNFTATHYHSLAKLSIYISLLIAISMEYFSQKKSIRTLIVLLCMLGGYLHFKNSIEYEPLNHKLYATANIISQQSKNADNIFIITEAKVAYPEILLNYISKRNVIKVNDNKEAADKAHSKNYVIYHLDNEMNLVKVEHLSKENKS